MRIFKPKIFKIGAALTQPEISRKCAGYSQEGGSSLLECMVNILGRMAMEHWVPACGMCQPHVRLATGLCLFLLLEFPSKGQTWPSPFLMRTQEQRGQLTSLKSKNRWVTWGCGLEPRASTVSPPWLLPLVPWSRLVLGAGSQAPTPGLLGCLPALAQDASQGQGPVTRQADAQPQAHPGLCTSHRETRQASTDCIRQTMFCFSDFKSEKPHGMRSPRQPCLYLLC